MLSRGGRIGLALVLANTLGVSALAGYPECGQPIITPSPLGTGLVFDVTNTDLPSGTCTPRIAVLLHEGGSVDIWLFYPCSGASFEIYSGPGLRKDENTLSALCGAGWAYLYTPRTSPSALAKQAEASAVSSPVSGQASQGSLLADVNGDGNADTINLISTGLSVQLLDGSGNVLATKQSAVGFTPTPFNSHVIAADFNGDGKLDLAVSYAGDSSTNLGGTVFVLFGNGDGTFGAPQSLNAGPTPLPIAVADFNKDGKPDIVVATLTGNNVSVLLGNGDGTFRAPVAYAAGLPVGPTGQIQGAVRSIVALDLNGDGNLDLALAGGNQVSVLLNSGNGSFGQPLVTPVSYSPVYLAYADLNHDGKLDLAVAGSQNAIILLFGKGDGTFQPPTAYAAGNQPASLGIVPATDSSTFLITADQFTNATWFTVLAPDGTSSAPSLSPLVGMPNGIAAADLNGDGIPDVVVSGGLSVGGQPAGLAVLLTNGTQFASPVGYAAPGSQGVAIGDLNNDGKPDVIVAGAPSVSVLLGNGNGTLKAPTSTTINQGAENVVLGDFNHDGKLDAAVAAFGSPPGSGPDTGGVVVLLGKGDGAFQPPTTLSTGSARVLWVATADLNGDGKLDLAAVLGAADRSIQPVQLAIFLGQGDGTFAPPLTMKLQVNVFARSAVAIGDLNGDGKLDLAVSSDQNGADILLGNGDGTFHEIAQPAAYLLLSGVALADIDGDGKLDLLTIADDGAYLLGNGDGTFRAAQHVVSGLSPVAIVVAKITGSLTPAVAYADQHTGVVALRLLPAQSGAAPVLISGSVANGATYLGGGLVPGSWAQVKGTGLSNVTRTWGASDFAGLGNNLPTSLSGVQVLVNNLPAAVDYIDSAQVNFQVPNGISGTASVQVINNGAASNTVTGTAASVSPGIFPVAVNGTNYPAAVFTDGKLAGDPSAGSAFRAAKPGEAVQLYATGLAVTPAGVISTQQSISGVTVTIGNAPAIQPSFAGLVAVGEFQINFNVPDLPAGSYPISIAVNGVSSPGSINSSPPGPIVLPIQP